MHRALVVTDDPGRLDRWTAWLELAGFETTTCEGPGITFNCPRVYGGRCARREMVDVAVVDIECDDDARSCTKMPDDGSTVLVRRGGTAEPDRHGLMGAVHDVTSRIQTLV